MLAARIVVSSFLVVLPIWGQNAAPLTDIKSIYVGSFGNKSGADQLRDSFISELRKSGVAAVVPNSSTAQAIVSGTGEIWIRGYYSLNPRSGRSPSNGKPIYGGMLSVEIKDKSGDTLWSYLVTPKAGSTSITDDLSKEVVKRLLEAVADSAAHKR